MKDHSTGELDVPSSLVGSEKSSSVSHKPGRLQYIFHAIFQWFIRDWQTYKYFFFGALLLLITGSVTVLYYVNYPAVAFDADTPAYVLVAQRLYTRPFFLVDVWRLPGYPLLIALVFSLAGYHNWMAVSAAQGVLFVLATMEIYVLAILVLKRTWMAFLIGLIVGTNVILLAYVKPIMSEGLALWLLTTLALAVVVFIRHVRMPTFWIVVVCMVLLLFTRPEWLYLPVPLFGYVLLVAARKGVRLRSKSGMVVLLNVLLALICIYTLVGAYIQINTRQNHYPGLTAIENYNLLGKVLQYNMQDEAPPAYAQISHQLDSVVARVDRDPYHILPYVPALSRNDNVAAGEFARAIILHHPIEFLVKSLPLFAPSLTQYYDAPRPDIPGPFDWPLALMKSFDSILYRANVLFLLCLPAWLVLFCWRRLRFQQLTLGMGAVVLLAFYALVITILGGYRLDDYMRVHIVFDPLLIFVIWGSIFLGARLLVKRGPAIYTQLFNRFRH